MYGNERGKRRKSTLVKEREIDVNRWRERERKGEREKEGYKRE